MLPDKRREAVLQTVVRYRQKSTSGIRLVLATCAVEIRHFRGRYMFSMHSYRGLTLTTAAGISWRWVGWTIAHHRGQDVRVEKWQAQCPACGKTVTIRAKIVSGLKRQFYSLRYNARPSEIVEVRLPVPLSMRKVFDIGNCNDHGRPTSDHAAFRKNARS
jgi:hypothetical protein